LGDELISPNWHVAMVHYPIALLTLGVAIELLAFPRALSRLRAAGNWMIVLGAVLCLPAAATGLYALHDVTRHNGGPWHEVVGQLDWSPQIWTLLSRHIGLTSAGTALALMAALSQIASLDGPQQAMRWPKRIVLAIAALLLTAGAWHGGEAVYRHGIGVEVSESSRAAGRFPTDVKFYVPPLQLHTELAGLALGLALAATAMTVRRWRELRFLTPAAVQLREIAEEVSRGSQELQHVSPPRAAPALFWLLTFLLVAATASAGLWYSEGDWSLPVLNDLINNPVSREQSNRLVAHIIGGGAVLVLPLVLAVLTRLAPRWKFCIGVVACILLTALAWQVFSGALMLYDGLGGPFSHFVVPATAPATQP